MVHIAIACCAGSVVMVVQVPGHAPRISRIILTLESRQHHIAHGIYHDQC